MAEQAKVALLAAAHSGAGDPAFLDVAACLSGITPAWTGGPLMWLWAEHENVVPLADANVQAAWARVQATLRRACA